MIVQWIIFTLLCVLLLSLLFVGVMVWAIGEQISKLIKGRGMGGDPTGVRDEISNLIPLCRECHTKTDNDREYNERLKLRLKRFIDGK